MRFLCPSLKGEAAFREYAEPGIRCQGVWDVRGPRLVGSYKGWTDCCRQSRMWEWLFPGTVCVLVLWGKGAGRLGDLQGPEPGAERTERQLTVERQVFAPQDAVGSHSRITPLGE